MKKLVLVLAVLALAVPFAEAQKEENLPTELKIITAGDVKVRYLNFKWDEAASTELTIDEFRSYVLDKWDWQESFLGQTKRFSEAARARSEELYGE